MKNTFKLFFALLLLFCVRSHGQSSLIPPGVEWKRGYAGYSGVIDPLFSEQTDPSIPEQIDPLFSTPVFSSIQIGTV